jgi:hypothetical protein
MQARHPMQMRVAPALLKRSLACSESEVAMNQPAPAVPIEPDAVTCSFYVRVMGVLDEQGIDYVVGGGYAMAYYTGIRRNTKDLDIFVRPRDQKRALAVLSEAGFGTEYFYPFWIAKALQGDSFVDIIYSSANGLCEVDAEWFSHALDVDVLGYPARLVPAEEQLFSKAFVQDRDRFDGADLLHLILCRGEQFDWSRLLRRFAGHERVLLSFLVLFGYVYPSEPQCIPRWVMDALNELIRREPLPDGKVCRGTNISQKGFLHDVYQWGYADARLGPHGPLTRKELDQLDES